MTQALYAHMNNKTIKKNLKIKFFWGMAQVVEHLPTKCTALNSNPSTASKNKLKSA
jgi:hypothetical protein